MIFSKQDITMNNFCQQQTIENIFPEKSLLKTVTSIFFYTQIISAIALLLLSNPPIFAQEKLDQIFFQDSITVRDDSLAATKVAELKRYPPDSSFKNILWEMPKSIMDQHFLEDLGGLLHYLPGVVVFDVGSPGQEIKIGFHGANSRQVSVFFDDRPLYDPVFGGFDLNFLPTSFISKVSAYGGNAIPQACSNPEIISFVSDDYGEDIPYSQVSYHKGPNGFNTVDVIFGQRISQKTTISAGGFIKSFDGITASHRFEQQNFRGKIEYALSPRWNFQYSLLSNKLNRNILNPDLDDISLQLQNATQKNNRIDHTLNISGRLFGAFNESFMANAFYSSQESKIKDEVLNLRLNTPSKYFGLNFKNKFFLLGQRASFGGNFIHEKADADSIGKLKHSLGSVFTQYYWNVTKKARVDLTGKLLFHNLFQTQFGGGITSFFQIAKSLELSASLKRSIRYPTFFELNSEGNYIGNTELREEAHQELNTGLRLKLKHGFSLATNVYVKSIERFIETQSIDTLTARFLNKTTPLNFAGADLQLRWEFLSRFSAFSIIHLIDNKNLVDQPNYKLTSYLQYADSFFQNDLRPTLRIEGVIIGDRKSSYFQRFYLLQSPQSLTPVFLLNAHLVLDFGNLKVFFSFLNLLNEKYQIISGYPMSGRSLHYGLRWEFWN